MKVIINCLRFSLRFYTNPKSEASGRSRTHTRAHEAAAWVHMARALMESWCVTRASKRSWRSESLSHFRKCRKSSAAVCLPPLLYIMVVQPWSAWNIRVDFRRAPCPPGTARSVRSCPRSARMLCPCWLSTAPGGCLQLVRHILL